ncbi:MAG: C40 family peptidase [Treponema sp.]|nr:C40 family peptidase [Treponema sp.]MBR0099626.1 C40 family peptidase [Treponema sp.]
MYGWAKKYAGIPFVTSGRDMSGCDCYGLVRMILVNEYGFDLPMLLGDYTNALNIAETKQLFMQNVPVLCGEKISEPEEKAVALMRFGGRLCHVGLYAGDGCIIHSRHNIGVVIERLSSPALAGCVEGWYRVDKSYSMSQSVLERKN